LEILYERGESGKAELAELAKQNSPHQIQLINFLLAKGKADLAHFAIENSGLQTSWKLARNAETSLALREYSETNECYFCDALRFGSISEMIGQNPKKSEHLINKEWFKLARQYGEWLYIAPSEEMRKDADKFLPAMTENLPKNADEQAKLGKFYLEKTDAKNALEHLWLALEMNPEDKQTKANLGTVYFQMGDEQKARELWSEIIADEDLAYSDIELYWQTLDKRKLQPEAREELFPIIIKKLKESGYDSDYYSGHNLELKNELANLIRRISDSFKNEKAKSLYFQRLAEKVSENRLVLNIAVDESLISKENLTTFYEMLIGRSSSDNDYDYSYQPFSKKAFSRDEAEEMYDHERNFKINEPKSERVDWQKKYLDFLIENRQFAKAKNLIESIENELARKYARPEWLRIAKIKTQIADGNISPMMKEAKRFIGIETSANLREIKPPSASRLNEILQILRSEKREAEARELLKAFYARNLTLEQFTASNLSGLARIYFEDGEQEKGLYILKTLVAIASENEKPEAIGDIATWQIVKTFAIDTSMNAETQGVDEVSQINALRLSSEVAEDFGKDETAIYYRQKLNGISPEDTENTLELARLFAQKGDQAEVIKLLAGIINNRNAEKSERWKAVWLAKEIVENRADLLRQISNSDSEIRNAFEILVNNKIKINREKPSAEFWFYIGLISLEFNQNSFAFDSFQNALIADKDAENPFVEESAFQNLTRLYIEKGQQYAAFKIYDLDKSQKPDELLNLLSKEAERIGEFQKASEFEKAKSQGIDRERIKRLEELEREKAKKATDYVVDLENTRKL
jgi:Tfp pilus assembly protein PilF